MVLVVDDHGDTRDIMLRVLTPGGYERVGVGCGGEALLYVRTRKPRLVLLDFDMPDMDGPDVLRRIRRDPRPADVPVVVFSVDDDDVRERALRGGAAAGGVTLRPGGRGASSGRTAWSRSGRS